MKPPRRFAEGTSVAVEKTRAEIERLVKKRGATAFGTMSTPHGTSLAFQINKRNIRFELPIPPIKDPIKRDAEERRLWRCLALNVKAKFEAVDNGIVSFDQEFLAHIVVPGSSETIGDRASSAIAAAYERGAAMPPLLNS